MSGGNVPTKIVLKGHTNISLNDRFSRIAAAEKNKPPAQNARAKMAAQQQSSIRNQRLLRQMENRPSVVAALKLKKRSMLQRIGPRAQGAYQQGDVKSRLSYPAGRGARGAVRGYRGTRGVRRATRGFVRGGRGRGGGGYQQATIVTGGGGAVRGRGGFRGLGGFRGTRGRGFSRGGRGGYVMRGVGRGRGGRGFRGARGTSGMRGAAPRGTRGYRGTQRGGRGRGRGRGAATAVPSKETLDNQLDEYMSKTKSHLDMELDTYMQEAHE